MTRDGLHRALVDLGWLTLIQRVLGGKPSSSYALYQLMRSAGRPVTGQALADEYANAVSGIGRGHVGTRATPAAITTRIVRLRAALADLGVADVVRTCAGENAYIIEKRDLPRLETALLCACGIELRDAA